MTVFDVLLTNDAAHDLEDIYNFIALHDSPQTADHVLSRIEEVFSSLSEFPERGVYPNELLALGIRVGGGENYTENSGGGSDGLRGLSIVNLTPSTAL